MQDHDLHAGPLDRPASRRTQVPLADVDADLLLDFGLGLIAAADDAHAEGGTLRLADGSPGPPEILGRGRMRPTRADHLVRPAYGSLKVIARPLPRIAPVSRLVVRVGRERPVPGLAGAIVLRISPRQQ